MRKGTPCAACTAKDEKLRALQDQLDKKQAKLDTHKYVKSDRALVLYSLAINLGMIHSVLTAEANPRFENLLELLKSSMNGIPSIVGLDDKPVDPDADPEDPYAIPEDSYDSPE